MKQEIKTALLELLDEEMAETIADICNRMVVHMLDVGWVNYPLLRACIEKLDDLLTATAKAKIADDDGRFNALKLGVLNEFRKLHYLQNTEAVVDGVINFLRNRIRSCSNIHECWQEFYNRLSEYALDPVMKGSNGQIDDTLWERYAPELEKVSEALSELYATHLPADEHCDRANSTYYKVERILDNALTSIMDTTTQQIDAISELEKSLEKCLETVVSKIHSEYDEFKSIRANAPPNLFAKNVDTMLAVFSEKLSHELDTAFSLWCRANNIADADDVMYLIRQSFGNAKNHYTLEFCTTRKYAYIQEITAENRQARP